MFESIFFVLFGLIGLFFVISFCGLWWHNYYYEEFGYATIIYNEDTKQIAGIINANVSLPKSHPFLQSPNKGLTLLEKKSKINSATTFVTDNQVICRFGCHLNLKIKEMDQQGLQSILDFLNVCSGEIRTGKLIDAWRFMKNEVVWERPVEKILYDFCNSHLSQMKELTNPLDGNQQKKFCDLVHDYFDHILSELNSNIEIECCRFSLS